MRITWPTRPRRRAAANRLLRLLCWAACALAPAAIGEQIYFYPHAESAEDQRASYPVELLSLCSAQSAGRYRFEPSPLRTQQGRSVRLLAGNHQIDVIWAVTSAQRERELLPVRIPIDRGLIGWRLLLIRAQDQPLFSQIHSRHQLAELIAGLGHDWPDVEVLRANRLTVATSTTYQGLFRMLERGHIQYFPRAISEIWPELQANAQRDLVVEPSMVLQYPEMLYFFVHRDNTVLARELTACLHRAVQTGQLQTLFFSHYRDAIERARLRERWIIRLASPRQAGEVPPLTGAYWFSPAELR